MTGVGETEQLVKIYQWRKNLVPPVHGTLYGLPFLALPGNIHPFLSGTESLT